MKNSLTGVAGILLLSAAILMVGCNKPQPTPEPDPAINYNGDSAIEIPDTGGSKQLSFTANRDWSVKTDAAWLHISPDKGSASDKPATVTITCDQNTGDQSRSATVTISINGASKTVTVTQPAPGPFLNLISESTVNLENASAGNTVVSFSTNQEWTMSTSTNWIHIAKASGTASGNPINVTVSIDENYNFEDREGSVTINAGTFASTITIKQPAAASVLELTCNSEFEVEFDEGCCCQGGVTISFTTNRDWSISTDAAWIHLDKESGKASETSICVLASIDNDSSAPRSATVTISVPGITRSVRIDQTVVPTEVPFVRTVFFEDFEDQERINDWTFIDRDNDGLMWNRYVRTESSDYYGIHSGDACLFSQSYFDRALTPDNWVFTPAISLPANDCYVALWVSPQDPGYPIEHYGVYVTEVKPDTADPETTCTMIHQSTLTKGTPVKTEKVNVTTHELHIAKIPDTFNGKSVYIGFRHFNSTDQFKINLDDVSVTEGYPQVTKAAPSAVQESLKYCISPQLLRH